MDEAGSDSLGREGRERRRLLKLGLAGAGAVLGVGAVGVRPAYSLRVNRYRIPVANLPAPFEGFRVAQLTDLHYGWPFAVPLFQIQRAVDEANASGADVIVCTGDYVHGGGGDGDIDTVWSRLCRLGAREGVYSVLGNHDHLFTNADRSLEWLEKSGQGVRHRAVPITRGGERIWIGGAGDYAHDELGIDQAFREAPPSECKVLLSHWPDAVGTRFETRIDLTLSGHTHGGQVGLPYLADRLSGLSRASGTSLFISRGVGWAYLPVRVNCAPEVAVLELCRDRG